MTVTERQRTARSTAARMGNHRRWHDGDPADCGSCSFTAEEIAAMPPPLSSGRRVVRRLRPDEQQAVLAVARVHGTIAAARWAGCGRGAVINLRKRVDGYDRGRGHPTLAEMEAAAVREDCPCPMCRQARGINHPALTPEQQAIVAANTGLVGFILRGQKLPDAEWEDAFQDGTLGLMRAAQKFDPTKGFAFSTYAVIWIRQAIERGRGTAHGRNYRTAKWRQRGDYVPPLSLDAPIGDEDDASFSDVLPDTQADTGASAVDAAYLAEVEAKARSLAVDRVDRLIVEELLTLSDESWTARDQAVADRVGYSREIIRQRRARIQRRLVEWAEQAEDVAA